MATLRDIARHAHVSPATVSLLLNGKANLREQTRQRIEVAIQELGYARRPVGRPRVGQNLPRQVGLLIPSFEPGEAMRHPLQRRRITSIRERLSAAGDQVSVFAGAGSIEANWVLRDAVDSGDLDAAVLISPQPSDGYIAWLTGSGLPTVVIERTPDHGEFSHVNVDSFGGGRQAGEALVELGHRRLGHVSVKHGFSWAQQRRQGFSHAVRATDGVSEVVEHLAIVPDGDPAEHDAVCRRLLDRGVTGIFAVNDGVAIRCVQALRRLGVSVPGEVSIIGFDDVSELQDQAPLRPTSIGYDIEAIAQATVGMIHQLLAPDHAFSSLSACIRTELRVHDTTAPAKDAPRRG